MSEVNEVVGLARKLISIPTENPPGDYEEFASAFAVMLSESGLEVQIVRGQPDKPNVVGLWKGSSGAETLLLSGHMDVVAAGDPSAWTHPPYEGVVDGGFLWGRGSADMKGALACMAAAVRTLRRSGFKPSQNVMVVGTVDDEIAGKMGLCYLLERGFREYGLPVPTFHVLGEATDLDLMVAFKGRVWIRIGVQGKAAHGGAPHEGVNAVEKALDLALCMRQLVSGDHPVLGPDTCNLGTISGGGRVNVVPSECTLEYDIRMGPPRTSDGYIARVQSLIAELGTSAGLKIFKFEVFEKRDPVVSPVDDARVRILEEVITARTGRRPRHLGTLSAGDLYYSLRAGTPGVWFGPGDPAVLHKVDERVPVEQLAAATDIYAELIRRLCS